jgi:excisionase family DNA binding protein
MERVLITTDEVLKYVGIGRATLYKLMKNGGFPRPAKIGNQNKWHVKLVDQFLIDSMPVQPKSKK